MAPSHDLVSEVTRRDDERRERLQPKNVVADSGDGLPDTQPGQFTGLGLLLEVLLKMLGIFLLDAEDDCRPYPPQEIRGANTAACRTLRP